MLVALTTLLLVQQPVFPTKRLVETARITETSTGQPWAMIGGVTPIGGGDLLVNDARTGELFRFGADGTPKGQVGRAGEGPGEFRSADWVGLRGDSVWVYDNFERRFLLFGPGLRPVRTVSVPRYGMAGVMTPDGSFVTLSAAMISGGGADSGMRRILHHTREGALADTVLAIDLPVRKLRLELGGDMAIVGLQPLDDTPFLMLLRDGSGWLRLDRPVEGPARFTLTVSDLRGHQRWQRVVPVPAVPVSSRFIDSVVGGFAHPQEGRAPQVPEGRVRATLFVPPRLPAATSAMGTLDHRVWVRREAGSRRYSVFEGDGRPAFEVELPPGVRFAGANGETVWGVLTTEEGEEVLVQYRLR